MAYFDRDYASRMNARRWLKKQYDDRKKRKAASDPTPAQQDAHARYREQTTARFTTMEIEGAAPRPAEPPPTIEVEGGVDTVDPPAQAMINNGPTEASQENLKSLLDQGEL